MLTNVDIQGMLVFCHINYTQTMNIISVKDLASLIKQERKARAWTQAQLAERSGVSRDWIITLEQAKPSVELALVLRTLKALNLPLAINQPSQLTQAGINLDDILDQTKRRGKQSS
jgi:HTH-type transcriptional regulator/antitoxin HipB